MNKNRTDGAANQAKGAVKEVAGKVTGNVGLQAKGAVQKTAGKVQSAAGKAEDAMKKPRA
jgi:uncharacterized protein YjbJ (UPF0337 family)